MTDEETDAEAVVIANEIEMVLDGRDYAASLLALGMVIGRSALDAQRPNLESLMQQLRRVAASTMRDHRHEHGRAH